MWAMAGEQRSAMAGSAPGLGGLITTRGMSGFGRGLAVAVVLLVMMGLLAGVVALLMAAMQGTGVALVFAAVLGFFFFLCIVGLRGVFRVVDFHEGGAVERVLGSRREVLYADVTRMSYAIARQYVNGVYAGTTLTMAMRTFDGRKLRYGGRYKEKPKGWAVTVFGKKFEANDEMDVVRDVVAAHVADRMMDQIARGEAVEWPGCGLVSADGIVPRRGPRKGRLLAWERYVGMSMDKGVLHLFAEGDKKSFLDVVVGAWNVFPVIDLIGTLVGGEQEGVLGEGAAREVGSGE